MAVRVEHPIHYKTMVKRAFVEALRDVFTSVYPEQQFQNLRIVPEFPQSKPDYAALYIRFSDSTIYNAGVGHVEYFPDPQGNLRKWRHRRFEGTLEFNVIALTPLDRDILTDALIELLSFGDMRHDQSGGDTLDDILSRFFYVLYGDPQVPYSFVAALFQMALNTDVFNVGGESTTVVQWQAEDVLIYSNTVDVELHGGFYNTISTDVLKLVGDAFVFPYADFELYPLNTLDSANWVTPTVYEDDGVVTGRFRLSTEGPQDGVVTGVADVFATAPYTPADSATDTGHGHPSAIDTAQYVDASVVTGIGIPSADEDFTGGAPPPACAPYVIGQTGSFTHFEPAVSATGEIDFAVTWSGPTAAGSTHMIFVSAANFNFDDQTITAAGYQIYTVVGGDFWEDNVGYVLVKNNVASQSVTPTFQFTIPDPNVDMSVIAYAMELTAGVVVYHEIPPFFETFGIPDPLVLDPFTVDQIAADWAIFAFSIWDGEATAAMDAGSISDGWTLDYQNFLDTPDSATFDVNAMAVMHLFGSQTGAPGDTITFTPPALTLTPDPIDVDGGDGQAGALVVYCARTPLNGVDAGTVTGVAAPFDDDLVIFPNDITFNPGNSLATQYEMDATWSNRPVVAWLESELPLAIDLAPQGAPYVKRWTGTDWELIGVPGDFGMLDGAEGSLYIDVAMDGSGHPWIAHATINFSGVPYIQIWHYTPGGFTEWTHVTNIGGGFGDSNRYRMPRIVFDATSNYLHVAYFRDDLNNSGVSTYDITGDTWTTHNLLRKGSGVAAAATVAYDSSTDRVYVMWVDTGTPDHVYFARLTTKTGAGYTDVANISVSSPTFYGWDIHFPHTDLAADASGVLWYTATQYRTNLTDPTLDYYATIGGRINSGTVTQFGGGANIARFSGPGAARSRPTICTGISGVFVGIGEMYGTSSSFGILSEGQDKPSTTIVGKYDTTHDTILYADTQEVFVHVDAAMGGHAIAPVVRQTTDGTVWVVWAESLLAVRDNPLHLLAATVTVAGGLGFADVAVITGHAAPSGSDIHTP